MFYGAVFMVIMSWSAATDDDMISCNPPSTRKTKPILLNVNHLEYTIYFFIWIDGEWKNQAINQIKHNANEICDILTSIKCIIYFERRTNVIGIACLLTNC